MFLNEYKATVNPLVHLRKETNWDSYFFVFVFNSASSVTAAGGV